MDKLELNAPVPADGAAEEEAPTPSSPALLEGEAALAAVKKQMETGRLDLLLSLIHI